MVRSNQAFRQTIRDCRPSLDDPANAKELMFRPSRAASDVEWPALFVRGTTLFAQQFDTGRSNSPRSPTSVFEDVWRNTGLEAPGGCTSAPTGRSPAAPGAANLRLAWVDSVGSRAGVYGPPQAGSPTLSRDGRLIVATHDTSRLRDNLWVLEHGADAACS